MKFDFSFGSYLMVVLLPIATVVADSTCCWPADPHVSLFGICDDMVDFDALQDMLEADFEARRRLSLIDIEGKPPVLKREDILTEDRRRTLAEKKTKQSQNAEQRSLKDQGHRSLKKIDFEAGSEALAAETQCYVPFFNEDHSLPGACEPCGTDRTCVTNSEICYSLMDITFGFLGGTVSIDSMACPDDPHDCCVSVVYEGVGLFRGSVVRATGNFILFIGDLLDAESSSLVVESTTIDTIIGPRPATAVEASFDFKTRELFEKFCYKFAGELCCEKDCEGKMDPHFKTWEGVWYDFNGECDLQFIKAPEFGQGLGLDIQIRTTHRYDYSYIQDAAIKIGDDVLEVSGWGSHMFNGVASAKLPAVMADSYKVTHEQLNEKQHLFDIELSKREHILVSTYKDFVNIRMANATEHHFGSSVGLMGTFQDGSFRGRDGVTIFEDLDAFGQEWQVLDTEESLFETARSPQYPQKCIMKDPAAVESRRRLGGSIAQEAAEMACGHLADGDKDMCVYDVLATGDLEVARAGVY